MVCRPSWPRAAATIPNQINNVLAFPGIFRGALDVGATDITEKMKVAAAKAIADSVDEDRLSPNFVVPSVFDRDVPYQVAQAVGEAALTEGICRPPVALYT